MKAASLIFLAVFSFTSCERHSFSETKKLNQPHGAHGAHAAPHGEQSHGEHAAQPDAASEKPAH